MNQTSAVNASSLLIYPDRGPWGDSKWRGNASGHVYRTLFEQLKPSVFVDPMVGGGTSTDVAKSMNIESYGLDLHSGFNALRHNIVDVVGKEADLVVSHPPYGGMVKYSGEVWGTQAHPDDLSHCISDEDFHEKMQAVLLNQRRATKPNGYYGVLIGDWRRNGAYTSYMAEMIGRMPSDELAAVLIKAQFNCVSNSKSYAKLTLPRIMHEYLILWRKKKRPVLVLLATMAREQAQRVTSTWKNIIKTVMMNLGGNAPLDKIYAAVAHAAPDRLAENPSWKAKVRQTLNSNESLFRSMERGAWALA